MSAGCCPCMALANRSWDVVSIARFAVGLRMVTGSGQERRCNVQGWQWLGLQQPAFQAAKAKDSLALTDQ